jgi:MFS family permease
VPNGWSAVMASGTERPAPAPAAHGAPRSGTRRAAWAGFIGTALEQYDFVIYGTASALVFSTLFFPNFSPVAGVIASFGAYAVGFAARPLGGLFFSRFGDRLGRKWVLVCTLLLMGISTMAIGLLPTYEQVGVLAPVLLVACRFMQGFGAGAEQSGGATLLTETAPRGRRGRLASLVIAGAAAGTAAGAGVWALVQLLPQDQVLIWGWRLVFLSSLGVTVVALLIRRRLNESPVFQDLKRQHIEPRKPVAEIFRNGRRPLLLVIFMTLGAGAQSYTYQVFMASYLITAMSVDPAFVPPLLLVAAVCGGVATVGFGILSDRIGRKPVYSAILGAMVLIPGPSFIALHTGSPVAISVTIILGFVLAGFGSSGVQMSYYPELFGNRYRYAGVTLGREFAAVLGGGLAPLICAALIGAFAGSWVPVAVYMSAMAAMSFVASRLAPETRDRDLTTPIDATRAQVDR